MDVKKILKGPPSSALAGPWRANLIQLLGFLGSVKEYLTLWSPKNWSFKNFRLGTSVLRVQSNPFCVFEDNETFRQKNIFESFFVKN